MCGTGDEDLEHFLLRCPMLEKWRAPVLRDIQSALGEYGAASYFRTPKQKVQLIVDFSNLVPKWLLQGDEASNIEYLVRRLIFLLHTTRHKLYLARRSGLPG